MKDKRVGVTFLITLTPDERGFSALVRNVECERGVEFNDADALGRFLADAARRVCALRSLTGRLDV